MWGHQQNSLWMWREVLNGGSTTYERHPSREKLIRAETIAIIVERPKYNKQHNTIAQHAR